MNKTNLQRIICLLIVFTAWGVLLLFASTPFPCDYDSVNYALAIKDGFNPACDRPHPPGYFFYIVLAEAVNTLVLDPMVAIETANALLVCVVIIMLYLYKAPCLVILLTGTVPCVAYSICNAIIYAALFTGAFLTSLAAFLVYKKRLRASAMVCLFAVSVGFRQDLSLFLFPVVLFVLIKKRASIIKWTLYASLFIAITSLWFIPTWAVSGRFPLNSSFDMFMHFGGGSSAFLGASIRESIRWALRALLFLVPAFGPGTIIYFARRFQTGDIERRNIFLLCVAALPSVLFVVFVHGPKPGYWATVIGVLLAWTACFPPLGKYRITLSAAIVANVLYFLFMPGLKEYSDIPGSSLPMHKRITRQIAAIDEYTLYQTLSARDSWSEICSCLNNCCCVFSENISVAERYTFSYITGRCQSSGGRGADTCVIGPLNLYRYPPAAVYGKTGVWRIKGRPE
jgi:hypothetical protein